MSLIHNTIKSMVFVETPIPSTLKRKPLMVGCSGGSGHNTAIQGILAMLKKSYGDRIDLPTYQPVLPQDKSESFSRTRIWWWASFFGAIGPMPRMLFEASSLPVLPGFNSLQKEVNALAKKEKERAYVDMLLDVFPAGYESAAIWNLLQRNDRTEELKKLIAYQSTNDQANHQMVYDYYFNLLTTAAENKQPYTEIISTQAMAIPALCDVVKDYNLWLKQQTDKQRYPPVVLDQYLTDLPSKGCIHFFNVLSGLSAEQQQQMRVYGVNMTEDVVNHFFPNGQQFAGLYTIPAYDNPMVREGFKGKQLSALSRLTQNMTIHLREGEQRRALPIAAGEQLGVIMLGSQASQGTLAYIETLLQNGIDKVFVFGGQAPHLQEKMTTLMQKSQYANKIIPLAPQGDEEMAALMSRSQVVVIRGGGLSVMEQMAMRHYTDQIILLHYANTTQDKLTSGISWEDGNFDRLSHHLDQAGVYNKKTTPERVKWDLLETRLIVMMKQLSPHSTKNQLADRAQWIHQLPETQMQNWMEVLKQAQKESPPRLPKLCSSYFDMCEQKACQFVELIRFQIQVGKKQLAQIIQKEIPPNEQDNYFLIDKETLLMKSEYDGKHLRRAALSWSVSKEFKTALMAYRTLQRLEKTLTVPASLATTHQNLRRFQKKFAQEEIHLRRSGFFEQIIEAINQLLATYFPEQFKASLTYHQNICAELEQLNASFGEDRTLRPKP